MKSARQPVVDLVDERDRLEQITSCHDSEHRTEVLGSVELTTAVHPEADPW